MNVRSLLSAAMVAAVVPAFAGIAVPAGADTPPQHVRGTIGAVSPGSLTVVTSTGPVVVALPKDLKVAGVVPGAAADIMPGTFIGTANVPSAGAARALEVVVFPDAMRGTGEGDYAWDLPGKKNAMTNGTVAAPHQSMTNATVSHITPGATRTVSVTYKGGTKKIAIPPNVPIVKLEPGSTALLVRGAHVFVIAAPQNGKLTALRILAGERGTVPPM